MSNKADKVEAMLATLGQSHQPGVNPYYAGYFICFNRGLFYEAHDVLEHLWLPQRHGPNGNFYKGLIQLAGAFVHLQKNRLGPAAALFKLSRNNLQLFPAFHENLDTRDVLALIEDWLRKIEQSSRNPLTAETTPRLAISQPAAAQEN